MKRSLVLLLDLLLIVISLAAFSTVRDKPALPLHAFAPHHSTPEEPIKTGKSPSPIAGADDQLLVNGIAVRTHAELEFVLDRFKPGDRVDVQFDLSWIRPKNVALVRYYSTSYFVAHLLVGLIFFFLGLLVYMKRPNDRGALYCHWSTVSVGVAVMTTWGHYSPQFDWTHFIRYVFAITYCVRPVILLHFTLVFPVEKVAKRYRILAVPYAIAVLLAVMQIYAFASAANGDVDSISAYTASFGYAALFSMVLSLTAVASFIHSYFISREYADRRKLRWTLAGFGAALISYVCLWQIPIALKQAPLLSESAMLLSTLIAPVAFTIAILRYNLFDIDHILSRASTYIVVLGATFLLYVLLLGTLGTFLGRQFAFTGEAFAYICAVAMLGVLLEPVRTRVQNLVDRYFFRARYNMRQAQQEIRQLVTEALTRETLISSVKLKIQELLQPENAITLSAADAQRVFDSSQDPIATGVPEHVEPGATVGRLETSYAIILAVRSKDDRVVAAIALGQKRSGKRYSIEDIDLLEYTSNQMSLVYERLDLMQALVERQLEAQRLQSVSEFKTQILNTITHDMKTPLSSIKMYAQLVERGAARQADNGDGSNYLEIIRGESDRLTALIDNVLDHARLERGETYYDFREIDINSVVERSITTVRYLLELQQFTLEVEVSPEPLMVKADSSMMNNVMINLITNAMKYSLDRRWIKVSTFVAADEALIQVSDRGTGISSEHLDSIFESFYRVEGQKGLQAKGVGLGLANVRKIVEAHRGTISVESVVDEGSTFTIRLPLV
ncbi:MAG TPA: HAMP domain-containing sensor histidine kinase [Candidatus Kapabacteria bacterium]|nr:HAMP domain-containing sensor histidine kinase [Candidatus Kapabacteria bacterium]